MPGAASDVTALRSDSVPRRSLNMGGSMQRIARCVVAAAVRESIPIEIIAPDGR